MKKLIALFAVLGFASSVHAAEGADISHAGDFRLQYTNLMNQDFTDDSADSPAQNWHQRLRWGTTVRAGEKLSAHFTLVHNSDWGSNSDQFPDTTTGWVDADGDGVVDAGETSGALTNNILIVNEAYATWVASDALSFKFGRGTFTMADGRFVSTNDFAPVQKAFDGVLASWDHEIARVSAFGVQGAKAIGSTNLNDFGTFFGVSADFKSLPEWLKTANLHVVQIKRDEGTYANQDFGSVTVAKQSNLKAGVVLTGEVKGFDWRVNYEMEDGENEASDLTVLEEDNDISTSMYDVEVGYTVANLWNTRFHAGYHSDSGNDGSGTDDETYDGFHYDEHINAGIMDVLGWGNLTYWRLGAVAQPADDISVGVEYLAFTQTEKEGATATQDNGGALADADGNPANGATGFDTDEDELGSELDLWVTKKYTNNFSLMLQYSMFSIGKEFKDDGLEDDMSLAYLEAKLTF